MARNHGSAAYKKATDFPIPKSSDSDVDGAKSKAMKTLDDLFKVQVAGLLAAEVILRIYALFRPATALFGNTDADSYKSKSILKNRCQDVD